MTEGEGLDAGRVVDGRYEVVRHLADGGMAGVYVAHDQRLGRDVALKVLLPRFARREDLATRFEQEARTAARLSHPNVVPVQDQGRDGDIVFIAMELVRGTTLREAESRPMTVRRVLDIVDELLAGLEAAHQRGLSHGDVKPENVLLDEHGTVKLTDFGLARAASSPQQQGGTVFGTAPYLAPELATGGPQGARSDVYAAALVLQELLTGRPVFVGGPEAEALVPIDRVVPSLTEAPGAALPTDLVEALAPVLRAATAVDPSRRTGDASALSQELAQARSALSEATLDTLVGGVASSGAGRSASGLDDGGVAMATESFPVTAHTKVIIPGATRAPEPSGARSRTRKLLAGAAVAVLAAAALVLGLTWGHDDPTKSPDPTTTSTSRAASASASSAPTSSTTSTTSSTSSAGAGQVTVPNVVGMVAGSAQAVLGSFGLGAQLPPGGTGATVTGQTPAAGTSVATGTTVALH